MSQRASNLLAASSAPADSAWFLWRQALKAGRGRVLLALGTAIGASAAGVVSMLVLAHVVALAFTAPQDIHQHSLLIATGLAAVIIRIILGFVSEHAGQKNAAVLRVALRHKLYEVLLEQGPVLGRVHSTGSIATTLMERIEACDGYIARYLPQLASAAVIPPVLVVLVCFYDPVAALILLLCGLLLPVFLAVAGIYAGKASRQQMQALSRLGSLFHDRLKHLTTLRIFGAAGREGEILRETAADFRIRTLAVLRVAFLSASALDLFFMLALAAIALHVMQQTLPLAQQLTVILLVSEFCAPLRALSASYHDRASAIAAVTDIRQMLQPVRPHDQGHRAAPSPLRHPSLEVRGLGYTYPGRTAPALSNFSLRVQGTEFLALTGPSGAGKSTLLQLLLGFIDPDAGEIFIAGQDLHLVKPEERTPMFAWVGQRNHLFHGTLADNIRLGRPDASEPEIMKAADDAHLGSFIRSLPLGLNTVIGERGYGLSGGQAQRIALARAFLRDAPILLLDEPTAGLDQATATLLMLTIRKLAEGRTVLMISHDPIALNTAERVVELEMAHA